MNYVRSGFDSDVYVFRSDTGLECWGCLLAERGENGMFPHGWFTAGQEDLIERFEAMRGHLKEHKKAGHKVPKRAFRRIREEIRKLERGENKVSVYSWGEYTGKCLIVKFHLHSFGVPHSFSLWHPIHQVFYNWNPYRDQGKSAFPQDDLGLRMRDCEARLQVRKPRTSYKLRVARSLAEVGQWIWEAKVRKQSFKRVLREGWEWLENDQHNMDLQRFGPEGPPKSLGDLLQEVSSELPHKYRKDKYRREPHVPI